jgi:hypothetical protein
MTFVTFDSAKDVWDMLAQRYNTINLDQHFQIVTKLTWMTKNLGQSVTEFYSEMTYLWDKFLFWWSRMD